VLPSVETRLPSFIYDTKDAIGRLVDHLHELGHRELLYLGPEYGQRSNQIAAQRERHFLAAACRHGIKAEAWTHGQPRKEREDPPDRLAEANYREEAMERWLHRRGHEGIGRGVTGVVCFNDITAVSACRALSRHGLRVPQDISVTGFDNLDPTRMHTRLTTVDARLIDLGVQAGELVLALADGGEKAIAAHRDFCEVIEPRLVVRESTAPACIHE
jgi:LacI family transcriptional regulator